jgi:hypothetical protein
MNKISLHESIEIWKTKKYGSKEDRQKFVDDEINSFWACCFPERPINHDKQVSNKGESC